MGKKRTSSTSNSNSSSSQKAKNSMKISLPYDWVAPDEDTGLLPSTPVGIDGMTWLQLVNYWNAFGYFMREKVGNTVNLEFVPTAWLKEKNALMQVPWWEFLCDVDATPHGEVEGWQAVWQVHPSVYDAGLVPVTIPNSTYVDESEVTQQRLWKQWGTRNHSHYYLPVASPASGITEDRYLIPTWSWGADILGTEMMYGQKESGVNLVSRQNFQQALNAELLQTVPITPTGT